MRGCSGGLLLSEVANRRDRRLAMIQNDLIKEESERRQKLLLTSVVCSSFFNLLYKEFRKRREALKSDYQVRPPATPPLLTCCSFQRSFGRTRSEDFASPPSSWPSSGCRSRRETCSRFFLPVRECTSGCGRSSISVSHAFDCQRPLTRLR